MQQRQRVILIAGVLGPGLLLVAFLPRLRMFLADDGHVDMDRESLSHQSRPADGPKAARPMEGPFFRDHGSGGELDASVQSLLDRAMSTALFVEKERRMFPPNTNGERLLAGLQRKLFNDDYLYAALITDRVDPSKVETVFEGLRELMAREAATAETNMVRPSLSQASSGPAVQHRWRSHYQALLESSNPGYRNVLKALDAHTSGAMDSDLFKDAALYVGLRTTLQGWGQTERQETEELIARLTEQIPDAELRAKSIAGYVQVSQDAQEHLRSVEDAYRRIFRFRFEQNHGVKNERLWVELDLLSLLNSGPGLTIPVR